MLADVRAYVLARPELADDRLGVVGGGSVVASLIQAGAGEQSIEAATLHLRARLLLDGRLVLD